jgi:hypothetical protein
MLAQLAVRQSVTPRALFITISPAQNRRVAAALTLFMAELTAPMPTSDGQVGFTAITLEAVVAAIASSGDTQSAAYLQDRYLNFQPVLELVLSDDLGPPALSPLRPPARSRHPSSVAKH